MASSTCKALGRWGAGAVVALALALPAPRRLSAQASATFAGSVIRIVHGDTLAVAGTPMQLHRVSRRAQGAIASATTDPRGRWRFRTPLEDSATYLVSTRYDGIEFFTPPLSTDRARPDTTVQIVVADTTSSPSARVTILTRHILVQGGDSAGWRGILDVVTLENTSGFTRIAPDTLHPAYRFPLPVAASQPEIADGDVGPDAVRFRNGTLELYAPLAPGELSFTVQYLLPAASGVAIPFVDTVTAFNLLVDGEGAATAGPRLEGPIPTQVQGHTYTRWSAPVPGGTVLELDLRAAKSTPAWLLALLVAAMAGGLVAALVIARRRPRVANTGGPA